jgi:hypothetical protein
MPNTDSPVPVEQGDPEQYAPEPHGKRFILSAQEWLDTDFPESSDPVIGSPRNCIVRPLTKNIIQGSEKSYKTTFTMNLMLGLSNGSTVFSQLPVPRHRKVLYLHGELNDPEIQERTKAAIAEITGLVPKQKLLTNFLQGRGLREHAGAVCRVNFCDSRGQKTLRSIVEDYRPDVLVLDPWQEFITGYDENSFKDVSLATSFFDEVIEDYKLTVFLVTHTGKDRGKGTRGHSLIAGWRDNLVKLDRNGKGNTVKVEVQPRSIAPMESFNLKFDKWALLPASGLTPQVQKIADFLRENNGHATKAKLGMHLGFGTKSDALRKALSRAAEAGAVQTNGETVTLRGSLRRDVQQARLSA